MKLEEQIERLKEAGRVLPDEKKMAKTIQRSKEILYETEQKSVMPYRKFLWNQSRFIQKKWWVFQFFVLLVMWHTTKWSDSIDMRKGMGIGAVLFVILVIPEFWKNRNCCSVEIEECTYYSLRQIYAARMILFSIADVLMFSAFCCIVSNMARISAAELMVHCLLPMSVTAGICFHVLCSKWYMNEAAAIGFCLLWSGIWTAIVSNKTIYDMISLPVWFALLGISVIYLAVGVNRTLNSCGKYLEEIQVWN